MTTGWLNLYLRLSGYIFSLKQKMVASRYFVLTVFYALLLIIAELAFWIVSLPLYLTVSPRALQERGYIFPVTEREPAEHLRVYVVRRKVSLVTLVGAGGIYLAKLAFIGIVSTYLLGAQSLLAASQSWDFNTPSDYSYDSSKIEVSSGSAKLVDQGGGGSCSGTASACSTFVSSPTCSAQAGCSWGGAASGATTNSAFSANATGWTYASWQHYAQGANSGNYQGAGGNPGGYVNINLSVRKGQSEAGYWRQAFTTTVNSPSTATLNLDWKSVSFGGALTTYKVYAFIDTGSGVPVLGQEVWSSPEITATTNWASVATIDIKSKVATAGTYYLKFAAYATRPNGGANNLIYISGFDNVIVSWSKAASCSGTPTACSAFSSSPTCSAQTGCSWTSVPVYPTTGPSIRPTSSLSPTGVSGWTSFTETATKNGGSINYQLSSDDGSTWKYWDGTAWTTAASSANSNSASELNTRIVSFPITSGKILWRAFLVSDGTQQIILDDVAIGYVQNDPPTLSNISASQSQTSGYVTIGYTAQDNNSDPVSLSAYEYSLTGSFSGEQLTMTPATSDPSHDGVTGLTATPAGTAHTFVWNARTDLGEVYAGTVYVRLRANDGIADSNYLASSSFGADYVKPLVSSVSAHQVDGSSNVQIDYNLFDNTADNILVELRISSDGGSTWSVPVVTTSGDVGATVSSGAGKSIIWSAGTDYSEQEQDEMVVGVRAKDKYQNQQDYVVSSNFVIDNRAPVVATLANLLAQPVAGASVILVGGSFSEGHPGTNNFYVSINDGGYGSATMGDSDTATPSDKNVALPAPLDGNDYISAVKIEHTDTFGHMTVNENASPVSAYKFVKPYTPSAPTISDPGEDSVAVIVNKNSSEVDGLEYAIFESTTGKYVQSDGTLSSGAYWQIAGSVTVTGLSQPISQYIFQVKSRNTSDTGNAPTSESDFSSGASSDYRSPEISIVSTSQKTDGSKYVVIQYIGKDYQNASNNLTKYEYSLNGSDWMNMTEKLGVGSDGIAGLAFNAGGASLVFDWDVGTDLPSVEDSSVYIRLQSNDTVTSSNLAVSPAFVVNTAGPVVSNIQAEQLSGTDNVSITYDLADGAGANNTVAISVSTDDGASYTILSPAVSGDIGGGVTAGLSRNIIWSAGVDSANTESSVMRVKIVATDSYGNEGAPVESSAFSLDTRAPSVSAVMAEQTTGSSLVAVHYSLSDLTTSAVEFAISSDSGSSWTVSTSTYTGDVGAGQIAGSRSFDWNSAADFPDKESATMRVRVRAIDGFGHVGAWEESSDFSVDTKVLSIFDITASQISDSRSVSIHYSLNKDATVILELSSDGGSTWTVATSSATGQVNTLVTAGNNRSITWNAGVDFDNQEKSNMRVRLLGYESSDFSVDTGAPLGLLSLVKFANTDTTVTMKWSSGVTDAHFDHYELWHGANRTDVVGRMGTASMWGVANDTVLSDVNTISTVITGLNITSNYYVKIWAVDSYGNEATADDVNVYTAPTSTPEVATTIPAGGGGLPSSDNTPPDKPVLSPLVSPTNLNLVAVSGLAEAGSSIELYDSGTLVGRLDNKTDDTGQFSQNFSLAEGEHILAVKAIDSSLNASVLSDTVKLLVKTTAPSLPIILSPKDGDKITDITPTIYGVAEPLSQLTIVLDGVNKFTESVNAEGGWQFKVPSDFGLVDGNHLFALNVVDQAGNKSGITALSIDKITLAPVVSAPVAITTPSAGVITTNAPAAVSAIPTPLPTAEIVRENIGAIETAGVPVPVITGVNVAGESIVGGETGEVLTFSGRALPLQDVIVYLHSNQALLYRARANSEGIWSINHSQKDILLSPGEHTIYAVAIDATSNLKSQPGPVATFTVNRNFWVAAFNRLSLQTTVFALLVMILSMIWLSRIEKTKK